MVVTRSNVVTLGATETPIVTKLTGFMTAGAAGVEVGLALVLSMVVGAVVVLV